MQKFSFWELYTSQWSFKNESKTLLCTVLVWFVISIVLGIVVNFSIFLIVWPVMSIWNFCIYQGFKIVVFAPFCYGVCYFARDGDPVFMSKYNEMLTWRK